jgi:hypothetical protein
MQRQGENMNELEIKCKPATVGMEKARIRIVPQSNGSYFICVEEFATCNKCRYTNMNYARIILTKKQFDQIRETKIKFEGYL